MEKKTLIVGFGFVGRATQYFLEKYCNTEAEIVDPNVMLPMLKNDKWDYVFLCVPTNPGKDGKLDLSILKEVFNKYDGEQIIRSTVGPDQVSEFDGATFWPEFLRENRWKEDIDHPQVEPIVGYESESKFAFWLQYECLRDLMSVRMTTPILSAAFKVTRNAFLAHKVNFANILFDIAQAQGFDYDTLRLMLENDTQLGASHWHVPGPDGKRGFGGKCFPKDYGHFSKLTTSEVLEAVKKNNER